MSALRISETAEHRAVVDYLRTCLGGNAVPLHVRNEQASAGQRIAGAKAGVLSGAPDLIILDGGRAIFVEMKPRGFRKKRTFNAHEQRQFEVHRRIRLAGFPVEICETLGEVVWLLQRLGVPLVGSDVVPEPIPSDEAIRARYGTIQAPALRVAREAAPDRVFGGDP